MLSTTLLVVTAVVLTDVILPGCSTVLSKEEILENNGVSSLADERPENIEFARCDVQAVPGYSVQGTVYFRQVPSQDLEIKVSLTGFAIIPGVISKHGFHVHQFGNLGNNCADARGHFDTSGNPHGPPNGLNTPRHVGDLGNILVDNGTVNMEFTDHKAMLGQGQNSILGRSIVIHALPDDFGGVSGNAGPASLAASSAWTKARHGHRSSYKEKPDNAWGRGRGLVTLWGEWAGLNDVITVVNRQKDKNTPITDTSE